MKRSLLILALVLAGLAPAAAKADLLDYALPQDLIDFIAATPEDRDLAVGAAKAAFTRSGQFTPVTFSAHGNPADARGNVELTDLNAHGDVDCLNVVEKVATLSGQFREPVSLPPFGTFTHFQIHVADNGEPVGGQPVDLVRVDLYPAALPGSDCLAPLPPDPIVQGNVVVMERQR